MYFDFHNWFFVIVVSKILARWVQNNYTFIIFFSSKINSFSYKLFFVTQNSFKL